LSVEPDSRRTVSPCTCRRSGQFGRLLRDELLGVVVTEIKILCPEVNFQQVEHHAWCTGIDGAALEIGYVALKL
jgi:hypothetical protein